MCGYNFFRVCWARTMKMRKEKTGNIGHDYTTMINNVCILTLSMSGSCSGTVACPKWREVFLPGVSYCSLYWRSPGGGGGGELGGNSSGWRALTLFFFSLHKPISTPLGPGSKQLPTPWSGVLYVDPLSTWSVLLSTETWAAHRQKHEQLINRNMSSSSTETWTAHQQKHE